MAPLPEAISALWLVLYPEKILLLPSSLLARLIKRPYMDKMSLAVANRASALLLSLAMRIADSLAVTIISLVSARILS